MESDFQKAMKKGARMNPPLLAQVLNGRGYGLSIVSEPSAVMVTVTLG